MLTFGSYVFPEFDKPEEKFLSFSPEITYFFLEGKQKFWSI
jgi:hypothetical protein